VFSKGAGGRRRWTVVLSLAALVLTIAIGSVLWQHAQISSVIELEHDVSSLKSVFRLLRASVIVLIVALWPVLIDAFDRWCKVSDAARAQLLALRWRTGGWLVLLEGVLGQNLLAHFANTIRGVLA